MGILRKRPKRDTSPVLEGIVDPEEQREQAIRLLDEASVLSEKMRKALAEVKDRYA